MELWIRSQNKEILQKTNALFIVHSDENIWSIIDNQNMTKYGEYTTRKRALEVLDEIQQILVPKFKLIKGEIEGSFDGTIFKSLDKAEIQQMSCYVYEMPKE